MARIIRSILYVLIIAFLAILFFFLGSIARNRAIEVAELACDSFISSQQEPPRNIHAKFVACKDPEQEQGLICWSVSMEGYWLIYSPPNADGTNNASIPASYCEVTLDALTGNVYMTKIK